MKALLLMFLVIGNGVDDGHVETVKVEMSSLESCDSVSKHILNIASVDPSFRNVEVSVMCLKM